MSRGKKSKKKVARRRREAASILALGRTSEVRAGPPGAGKIVRTTRHAEIAKPWEESSGFAVLFASDELRELGRILRKSDLSDTPLLLGAVILGKTEVARRLLKAGHPIDSRAGDRTTGLMWAVRRKDLVMIDLLVRSGADLTLLDDNEDNVALIAAQSASWGQYDFLDFWRGVRGRIDPDHANGRGCTILDYAAKRRWDVLAALMRRANAEEGEPRTIEIDVDPRRAANAREDRPRDEMVAITPRDVEKTMSYLCSLFEDVASRYRRSWRLDREQGYPGYRGSRGDPAPEERTRIKEEEIARLNAVLPKLEDTYMNKLRESWSSLVAKLREVSREDPSCFQRVVTLVQWRLLTHEVCESENFVDGSKEASLGGFDSDEDALPVAESLDEDAKTLAPREASRGASPARHEAPETTGFLIRGVRATTTPDDVTSGDSDAEPLPRDRLPPPVLPPRTTTRSTALTLTEKPRFDRGNDSTGEEVSEATRRMRLPVCGEPSARPFYASRWDDLVRGLRAQAQRCDASVVGNVLLVPPDHRKLFTISPGGNFGPIELGLDVDGAPLAVRRLDRTKDASVLPLLASVLSLRHDRLLPFAVCTDDGREVILGTPLCEYNLGEYLMCQKMSKGLEVRAVPLIGQFLNGLRFLHARAEPVVHGNVKPSNLLIDRSGALKLAEFGLWRSLYRDSRPPSSSMIWFASESYRTYEEDEVLGCDCATDVQVAGMIAHFILTGGLHPYGTRIGDILENIGRGKPAIQSRSCEGVDLISWMLVDDPAERPTISQVLTHVFFWDTDKKWSFLLACAGVAVDGSPLPLPLRTFHEDLETKAFSIHAKGDWLSVVRAQFPTLIEDNYSNTPTGLLSFLRKRMESQKPARSAAMQRFFLEAFPTLPLSLYRILETTQWLSHPVFSPYTRLD